MEIIRKNWNKVRILVRTLWKQFLLLFPILMGTISSATQILSQGYLRICKNPQLLQRWWPWFTWVLFVSLKLVIFGYLWVQRRRSLPFLNLKFLSFSICLVIMMMKTWEEGRILGKQREWKETKLQKASRIRNRIMYYYFCYIIISLCNYQLQWGNKSKTKSGWRVCFEFRRRNSPALFGF